MVNLKDFDYLFYLDIYPDLKSKNINTKEKAIKHYKEKGAQQNRFYDKKHAYYYYHFDWKLYLEFYKDLHKDYKSNWEAYKHYMNHGIHEDRKIFPLNKIIIEHFNWDIFDSKFYIEFHNELNLKNNYEAIQHFKKIGAQQNKLHSTKHSHLYYHYDWNKYIFDYEDLNHMNKKQAFCHYIQYGINENRIIYKIDDKEIKLKDFHWEFYLLMNDDLTNNNILTYHDAYAHFKDNGINEDRFYSHAQYLLYLNYNWNQYNIDYKLNMSPKKAFIYYYKYGKNKNHKINTIFHEKNFYEDFYVQFNKLKLKNLEECKKHYLKSKIKSPYSYQHFLIFNFFDWDAVFEENKKILKIYKLINTKSFFSYYLNHYTKLKIKLILNIQVKKILSIHNISLLFSDTQLLQLFIKKNIVKHDFQFIKNIFDFQKKIIDTIHLPIQLLDIPLFFEFNNTISLDNHYHFSFVISSFNNEKNIKNNLLSILYQNYKNWKIYYSNDASTDKTDEYFHKIINDYEIQDKVHYTYNKKNMKQSYCKYHNYHIIPDEDIVVILDGDDWLGQSDALNIFHDTYFNHNYLILYSGYKVYYQDKIEKIVLGCEYPKKIKEKGLYRQYKGWHFTHVKTGFSWLFKKIPVSYFQYKNQWLDRCTDLTEMYAVAELAKEKVGHIKKALCIYNKTNSINYNNSYYNDYNSKKRIIIENYVKNLPSLTISMPKIFIINLKYQIENKQKIIDQLDYLNIKNYEFFEAINGYENINIQNKYDEYINKYNNNIIQKEVLTVQKKHIHNLGALGIIYSTLSLYKNINKNKNLDHVIICEDDIYFHKDFSTYYSLTNYDLKNKDFIYLGYNSTSLDIQKIIKKKSKYSLHLIPKDFLIQSGIYGAYSYICSRKFREYLLNLGIDYFINNNLNLDISFNIINYKHDKSHIKNDLTFYILKEHLCIPEVRKNGINIIRDEIFYKERFMNLDNYLI